MGISDSDHLAFMRSTAEALGRIESKQESTLQYLNSVSSNVKTCNKRQEDHERDDYAHGIGLRIKIAAWVAGIPSAFAGILFAVKKLVNIGGS